MGAKKFFFKILVVCIEGTLVLQKYYSHD